MGFGQVISFPSGLAIVISNSQRLSLSVKGATIESKESYQQNNYLPRLDLFISYIIHTPNRYTVYAQQSFSQISCRYRCHPGAMYEVLHSRIAHALSQNFDLRSYVAFTRLVVDRALKAPFNYLSPVSGLLITGRAGAGKTSIVRSVAKSIQEDPRTLACNVLIYGLYVSKFNDIQTSTMLMLQSYRNNLFLR